MHTGESVAASDCKFGTAAGATIEGILLHQFRSDCEATTDWQVVALYVAHGAAAIDANIDIFFSFDYRGSAPYRLSPLLLGSAMKTISTMS